ncbi:protein trafficking Pga2 [Triangularia setosa]|uniref:Protein trafficking Pga2 n=1 Tax=Triangularia setosa TaxID=2587417 RepID=A0AAN6WBA3_9PEZI|nr:protein trafficking Pga2 [Podospora setosa]
MEDIAHLATTFGDRFTTNLKSTLDNMSPQKWIRVIIVAGTYLLLRPYLMKLGGRAQMASYEDEHAATEAEFAAKAKISPNELRGNVNIPDDTDSEGEDEEGGGASSATDWGKKARRRQRDMIKKLLEAEERRLQESKEEEEDKDIEEFLIKD